MSIKWRTTREIQDSPSICASVRSCASYTVLRRIGRLALNSIHSRLVTAVSSSSQLAINAGNRSGKAIDVVALGNLCVDIILQDKLSPEEDVKTAKLLQQLTAEASLGDSSTWEAGAQSNFLIAAARLGLRVASAANLGKDKYGEFLLNVLQKEGVQVIEPLAPYSFEKALSQTLLCFVLLSPRGDHRFCSRYDFGPWPLLPGVSKLPSAVLQLLESTSAVFVNGFIFDELNGSVVMSAMNRARRAGAAIFFDPGPRAWTLRHGRRKRMLNALLDASHVVLMTQEEAEAVTGLSDPKTAAAAILNRQGALTQWCVIKIGSQGALIFTKHPARIVQQPAIQVHVADTVGCGDSFAAGIVLGYIQQHALAPVLALSNAVGAATATAYGAGRNVATLQTVRELLHGQTMTSDKDAGDQGTLEAKLVLTKCDVCPVWRTEKVGELEGSTLKEWVAKLDGEELNVQQAKSIGDQQSNHELSSVATSPKGKDELASIAAEALRILESNVS